MKNQLIGVALGKFDLIDEPPGVGPHPQDSQELSNVPSIVNTFFMFWDRPTDRLTDNPPGQDGLVGFRRGE